MVKAYDDLFKIVEDNAEEKDYKGGCKIYKVKSINPLVLAGDGIEISSKNRDRIYIHPLFICDLINQDESSLELSQNFHSTSAYQSPEFVGIIEGTIPDFLKEFYLFYKNWQSVFLLHEGDMVVMLELGEGDYLVLQKVVLT